MIACGSIVKVYVGEEKQIWQLHEDLLCDRSEYFKRAFQGKFKEGHSKEIHLEEADPAAFGCFVDWVYGAPLELGMPAIMTAAPSAPSATELERAFTLCQLYTMAQYLCIQHLQDDVVELYSSYIRTYNRHCQGEHIEYIYTYGQHPSPLHHFVARAVAMEILSARDTTGRWDSAMEKCPTFAVDIVREIQEIQKLGGPLVNQRQPVPGPYPVPVEPFEEVCTLPFGYSRLMAERRDTRSS